MKLGGKVFKPIDRNQLVAHKADVSLV